MIDAQNTRSSMPLEIGVDLGGSSLSNGELARLVKRKLRAPHFALIQSRRKALYALKDFPIWEGYGTNRLVSPREISIGSAYGAIIYSILAARKITLAIEAGSGFGISGMYILSALSQKGGALISFEAGIYSRLAQDSFLAISSAGIVISQPFEKFETSIDSQCRFDFAFLDAIHDRDHIVKHWALLSEYLTPGALVIIDDVTFNSGTESAWNEIIQSETVAFAALVNRRLGVIEVKGIEA